MKQQNMLNELPSNIPNFHNENICPICRLKKATRMKRNKTVPSRPHHKKEMYCERIALSGTPSQSEDSHDSFL